GVCVAGGSGRRAGELRGGPAGWGRGGGEEFTPPPADTHPGGSEESRGDARLSRDPARAFGLGAQKPAWTGADVCRVPKARAGCRTASSGGCVDRERQFRRNR